MDKKYDKDLFRYYFYVVWYPILYWLINPILIVLTLPKGVFGKMEGTGMWQSPER